MSHDNKPEPVVTQDDERMASIVARQAGCPLDDRYGQPESWAVHSIAKALTDVRTAAVARREAEIVGKIMEYANIANERYVYDDLRKLCAMIQGKPLPKTTAEIVQEQIGRSMDRPDKFPSIE